MASILPTPASFTAGDTLSFGVSLSDYPASESWVLKYRFINAANKYDITAVANGDGHTVAATAAVSALWVAGDYTWQAYVEKAAERYTVGTGKIKILPDLAAKAAGFDARGTAAKAVDDLKLALATWSSTSGHISEYEIAGRRMKFKSALEIQQLMDFWKREAAKEAAAERLANGLPSGSRVLVRY